jgi:hypothetical protein
LPSHNIILNEERTVKKFLALVQLTAFITLLGCNGMLHPPATVKFYQPREEPIAHKLAIGPFEDNSFARYPLFITSRELQDLFQDETERNHCFNEVFTVRQKSKEDMAAVETKAVDAGADLIMTGEISESECHFVGSNALGIPMYLLIGTIFGFPIGFNIKAQTWEGVAEVIYSIKEIKTGDTLYSKRVSARAFKNFSIWDERTERQTNKNFVRRMLTPLVLQNLKAAVAKDICQNFEG